MYKPLFNQVLVEVDTKSDKWGTGNDDSMLGKDYREGSILEFGPLLQTAGYPVAEEVLFDGIFKELESLIGKSVMWNQGHEAGKTFEHDGKLYAFVFWWDLVAVKDEQ